VDERRIVSLDRDAAAGLVDDIQMLGRAERT
jgi:hypothetical protein